MEERVSIMHSTVYGILTYILVFRLTFSITVGDLPICVKLDQFILIAFVLNKYRLPFAMAVLQKQITVRSVAASAALFGFVFLQSILYFRVWSILLNEILEFIML